MNNDSSTDGRILLTGGAGFLGQGFLASLDAQTRSRCVCIVRKTTPELAASVGVVVEGFFGDVTTLAKLDAYPITTVVHLAAVTGGCSEEDAMNINIAAPRVLLRHFSDRGCRRFVLASSIAAVGLQRTDFQPLSMPIADTHPCLDIDGYGFSKFMMEQVAAYHHRQNPALTIYCLRFGVISPDEAPDAPYVAPSSPPAWTYAHFSKVRRRDAVGALNLARTKSSAGGFHVLNIVARQADLGTSVPELLAKWCPQGPFDLSAYEVAGHERDAVFSTALAKQELGFTAEWP
ncbi:MAG: NAD(P)-dependent oxidoreductase [Rariglobus sp.]